MRIQQVLEKYVPLISYMLVPAIIYAVSLLSFLINERFETQTDIWLHYSFYGLSIISILILLNFNINRHMSFTICSILCYVLINYIKREYGADFSQTIWFNYLIILFPLNVILFYLYGRFRFISSKSLHVIMIILLEYGVVEVLGKHNINLSLMIGKINILAVALYLAFILLFLIEMLYV